MKRKELSEETKKKLLLEWKEKLNEREYREEITNEEIMKLKELGIVAMFGASDDLLEFRGAYSEEEFDCYIPYDFKILCYVKEADTFVPPNYYKKHNDELIQVDLDERPQIKVSGPAWIYTMPDRLLHEKAQIIETNKYTGIKDVYGELVLFFWEDFVNSGKDD